MTVFELFHAMINSLLATVRCYVLELIILMFITLFSLWTFAFLANGLYNYHFDLQSCWGGFSAISGAGVLAIVKYCTDSWKNSAAGVMPPDFVQQYDKNNDGRLGIDEVIDIAKNKVKCI